MRVLGVTPITVLGTADGQPESLSAKALYLLREATVVAGGKRHLAQLAAAIPIQASAIELARDTSRAVEQIREAAAQGERIVVLASGDPLLYGIGATLVRALGRESVRIVPAVSSVQLAFAAAGEPWQDATILSAHGRPIAELLAPALANTTLAILTDGSSSPSAIAEALIEAGMEDCRAVVCQRLGDPDERTAETTLHRLPTQAFDPLNVLLLFRPPSAVRLTFGRPDEELESVRGQITKAEVRAVTLSKLRLAPNGVLWDVGAGSGALAIDAAALMPRGTVFAVERNQEQLACLERNVARHRATNVRIVAGQAPEALAGLPAPDSVFLGGHGGRLAELIATLPRPFVTNLAIIEHVSLVLQRFPNAEVSQIAVSRSQSIGEGHRLAALNPVYVVAVPA